MPHQRSLIVRIIGTLRWVVPPLGSLAPTMHAPESVNDGRRSNQRTPRRTLRRSARRDRECSPRLRRSTKALASPGVIWPPSTASRELRPGVPNADVSNCIVDLSGGRRRTQLLSLRLGDPSGHHHLAKAPDEPFLCPLSQLVIQILAHYTKISRQSVAATAFCIIGRGRPLTS